MKTFLSLLVCVFTLGGTQFGHCGFFFDDPVQFSLTWQPHLIGKDQVFFSPSGKHVDLLLIDAYYTIEVEYGDHTATFYAHPGLVCSSHPLIVDLPEGIKGIKAVSLKAKWQRSVLIGRFKKNVRLPEKPTPKELADSIDCLTGLKVDSSWTVQ